MKKMIFGIAALAILFSGCSADDNSGSNTTTVDVISTLTVDGQAHTPGSNSVTSQNVWTTYTASVNSGAAHNRMFQLNAPGADLLSMKSIQVSVNYPAAQASVDGTYYAKVSDGATLNNSFSGAYVANLTTMYFLGSGSVTVTDLGNNNYKLVFVNVKGVFDPFDQALEKTISGTYQGNFVNED